MAKMYEMMGSYLNQIQQFDALSAEAEQALARRWRDHQDQAAFATLLNSYLRLVVKVAGRYKGYGLPMEELIQEGNIGLMEAIRRFDPDKGFRLSTYAMFWIKAEMQAYILNNWSMIKIGTSSMQKKLFFNLRRLKKELLGEESQHLSVAHAESMAKTLGVPVAEVIRMDQRLRHGDESLNSPLGGHEDGAEWQDMIMDSRPNPEVRYAAKQQGSQRKAALHSALDTLDARERSIVVARHLIDSDESPTLEAIAIDMGVSRERVRQLEARALAKVGAHLKQGTSLQLN